MVEHAAGPASPLAVLFMTAVIVTGLLLGLVRGRGSSASDPGGWSADDDGHCGGHDAGSCDGH